MRLAARGMAARRPILVVEDDPLIREAMTAVLEMDGFEVAAAADGNEALCLLRVVVPCIILLDLEMPGMDGWGFRAEQIQDGGLARIPVVVLSGRSDAARQALMLHVAAGLQKPLDLDALRRLILEHGTNRSAAVAH